MFNLFNRLGSFKNNSISEDTNEIEEKDRYNKEITPATEQIISPESLQTALNNMDSNVCVTPFKTKPSHQKEVAIIIVDKNSNKTLQIQAPSTGLICRFKDIRYIEDGKWVPYFNFNLLGIEDFARLQNSLLEVAVTRFIPTDKKFSIFGDSYVNVELPEEIILTYVEEEDVGNGKITGKISKNENDHFICTIADKTNDGQQVENLSLPKFHLVLPIKH